MIFLQFLAGFCLIAGLLTLVRTPFGFARIFDFPRTQIAIVSLIAAISLALFQAWIWAGIAFVALCIQLFFIGRFTPFWPRRSANFVGDLEKATTIKILTFNIKQGNQRFDDFLSEVQTHQPDVIVLVETNQAWIDKMAPLMAQGYEHQLLCPLENTYGMALYSRFEIIESQTRYLLNPEVPSFDMALRHPTGACFRLMTVHPEPPLFHKDTIGRDAELAFVANIVRQDDTPALVTGDLNDVAWSLTTRRFLRLSRLLDPREGRGQFNTFDARIPLMRWPLDHIFHSPHFQLVDMRRLPYLGSDHFPMLYTLALTDARKGRRRVDAATDSDISESQQLIDIEAKRDRRPAGHNWED